MFQVNGDTLMNPSGILQRRFCRVLLSGRAIDVVATDAHDCEARPVNLAEAYSWLTENTDETYASDLTTFGGVLR
jgi:tyrosine-protein phosphatase YwqE